MFCPNCGKELKDGSVFCSKCGYDIKNKKANTNNSYINVGKTVNKKPRKTVEKSKK